MIYNEIPFKTCTFLGKQCHFISFIMIWGFWATNNGDNICWISVIRGQEVTSFPLENRSYKPTSWSLSSEKEYQYYYYQIPETLFQSWSRLEMIEEGVYINMCNSIARKIHLFRNTQKL